MKSEFSSLFFTFIFLPLIEVLSVVKEAKEATKPTKMEELKNETIPFYLEKLDAMAAENNGYLALGQVNKITNVSHISSRFSFVQLQSYFWNIRRECSINF